MNMAVISDLASGDDEDRVLLVLLPGAHMTIEDFSTHGIIRAVRQRPWPVDVIAVDTGMDPYLDNEIADRLHEEVIAPAQRRGASRIWLAGISLGGMGALLYAQAHGEMVEGVLLLSPFIGSQGLVAEVVGAGGLRRWNPATDQNPTPERRLLAWLRAYRSGDRRWPDMRLAYGDDDRYAAAYRLLADILPPDVVLTGSGGHDWSTWEILWERLLLTAPFAPQKAAEVLR